MNQIPKTSDNILTNLEPALPSSAALCRGPSIQPKLSLPSLPSILRYAYQGNIYRN